MYYFMIIFMCYYGLEHVFFVTQKFFNQNDIRILSYHGDDVTTGDVHGVLDWYFTPYECIEIIPVST